MSILDPKARREPSFADEQLIARINAKAADLDIELSRIKQTDLIKGARAGIAAHIAMVKRIILSGS